MVDVARQYFGMPDSPRLKVAVEDGRRYLQRNEQRYDVIALDAYFSDSIPFHLATTEFVDLVRQRLAPGGVVVANIIGSVEGPGSRLFRSFVRTYRTAFPTVAVHPVIDEGDGGGLTELRNLMLVASEGALPSEEFLLERWRELAPATAPDLEKPIRDRYDKQIRIEDVPTLTATTRPRIPSSWWTDRATLRRRAEVAELADAPDSKSGAREGVWVRSPPSASGFVRRYAIAASRSGCAETVRHAN